jgi:hypothetical protein
MLLFQDMDNRGRAAKTAANTKIFKGVKEMLDNWDDQNQDVQEVIVIPPDRVDILTDDEDELQQERGEEPAILPREISGTLEIQVNNEMENNEPTPHITKKWMKGELEMERAFQDCNELLKMEEMFPLLSTKTPYELFKLFLM